ncbi:MAG: hypothetical protein OSB09_02575 [Planctomycetota bacterium]|nr:hypothetical protein [Planctomycetota bacterium]
MKIQSISSALVVSMLLGALLLSTSFLAAQAAPELSWKKGDGAEVFQQGKTAYEADQFKEAYAFFKDARKKAKNRDTRSHVGRWLASTEGANELQALKKQASEGKESAAYRMAVKNYAKFSETFIGEEYKNFLTGLQRKLFHVLEDFERVSRRYSEKYGKKFIDEVEWVQEGKRALQWDVASGKTELKIKGVPGGLSAYKSIAFYLDMPRGGSPYQLVFVVPGKSEAGVSQVQVVNNAYIAQMKSHKGLKRIEVPLRNFKGQGDVSWDRVKDFRIQFLGAKKFTAYVDFIALLK